MLKVDRKFSEITHLVVGPIFDDELIAEFLKLSAQLRFHTYLIAVDGGADFCRRAALIPDEYFGDDDSISPEGLHFLQEHQVKKRTFDTIKDFSDFAAVLEWLARLEAARVLVVGMSGGRLDQQLAVIGEGLLANLERLVFYGKNEYVEVASEQRNPQVFSIEEKTEFTVLSLTQRAQVSISGAKWELSHKELERLSSLGLSNLGPATVTIESGAALIITNRYKETGSKESR